MDHILLNNFTILNKTYRTIEFQNFPRSKQINLETFRKSVISFRKVGNGIRINASGSFPTLNFSDVEFYVYKENEWKALSLEELKELQSYPNNFQFPSHFKPKEISSIIGNGINLKTLEHFLDKLDLPIIYNL